MKKRETATILLLLALAFPGEAAAKELTVTIINDSPSRWWNKQVTLKGEVEKLYSKGAFVFEGDEENEGGDRHKNQILVIPQRKFVSGKAVENLHQPESGEEIRVKGTVHQMTKENITDVYGRKIPPEVQVAIKGSMPVIVAEDISKVD